MNLLMHLPLAELLAEVRTAERLAVLLPPTQPHDVAAVHRASRAAARAERLAELDRRAVLVEAARAFTQRQG